MVSAYVSMSEGEPQPITAMKVGIGRARRPSGVIWEERVRRYSWQFCQPVSLLSKIRVLGLSMKNAESCMLTPQKKCLMKITRTRRATFGPVYIDLKGTLLPLTSNTG